LASLQARSSLRSAHPLIVVNKLISLTAFMVLLAAGWVAVNYLKNEMLTRWRSSGETAPPAAASAAATQSGEATADAKAPRLPIRMVYSCVGDKQFYHNSTHLPAKCDRTAMSEEAARSRGLNRCRLCLPD
jgi:ABC-type uncharacterized transport system YnjBCD permease subunit